jgi:tetratricopeptide (TPR) repeat protein
MRSAGTISFPLLLLAACSSAPLVDDSPRASVEDSTQPAATPVATSQDDDPLDGAAARQEARREARALIVQMHLEEAGRLKENGRLKDAAREVAGALELAPDDARVQNLAAEIAALLGDPNGDFRTVSRILTDEWQLRMQQLKADTEDLLDRGKLALSRQDFDQAVAELSLAAVSVARAPQGVDWGGMDAEIESLLEQAKSERVAQAEAVRDAAEKAAIAELRAAREAEQARQQAIVQNMVDEAAAAFNARDYDDAVGYAEEALAMDAKNEQAFEIREAAFKAGRDRASEDYIREKTEQFARWREHLAEMEIPWTDTVTLPGREQWRALTELRSKRRGLDLSTKVSPAEQALRESLRKTTVVLPGIEGEEEITPLIQIIADYTQLPIIVDPMAEDAVSSAGAVFDINFPNPITVEQALDFLTEVGGEEVTWTVRYETVIVTTIDKARGEPQPYYHDVQDLIMGVTDFTGPRIDRLRLLDELEDDDGGGPFGGILEAQRLIEIEDLATIIQENVAVESWDGEGVSIETSEGGILVTQAPEVQLQIREFLEDLRRFNSSMVTIESKFMSVGDAWIQEIGVDFRGANGVDLTDITNGLEDQASRGLDNGGTGSSGSNAAGPPSAGFFYDDGGDGDFRGRTENFFDTALGGALNTIGGMSFQFEFLDDAEVNLLMRAIEKTSKFELVNSQLLSVNDTQRAYVTVVNQKAYIQDFDVEVAQFQAVADPQVNVLHEGVVLDVRPTIHENRRYLTLEIQPTVAKVTNVRNISTTLGGNTSPVNFELPELEVQSVNTSAVIPDGGSILLGGLSDIRNVERKASIPWISEIPILGFLFKQEGFNDERESLMILIRAEITDIRQQVADKLEKRW